MKSRQNSDEIKGSAMKRRAGDALTRRELLASSLVGATLLGTSPSLLGQKSETTDRSAGARKGRRIIDSHVHLWKLPRNAPPMSDDATFPTGCCGSVPWMEVDRLPADYDARVGGPKVDKVVLVESSVGVTADKIMQ